jgi:hypothetical protein
MTHTDSHEDARVQAINCPVYGDRVTCRAFYRNVDGADVLVEFECNMEGMCGIPSWDPCPLYVAFLERTSKR